MNKTIILILTTAILFSCVGKKTSPESRGESIHETISYNKVSSLNEYSKSSTPSISNYDSSIKEDNETDDVDSESNNYQRSLDRTGKTITHDMSDNNYHVSVDGFGNSSARDLNGNFYHFYTDEFGNTTGYDSNGNHYSGHTDDFGNTTINIY